MGCKQTPTLDPFSTLPSTCILPSTLEGRLRYKQVHPPLAYKMHCTNPFETSGDLENKKRKEKETQQEFYVWSRWCDISIQEQCLELLSEIPLIPGIKTQFTGFYLLYDKPQTSNMSKRVLPDFPTPTLNLVYTINGDIAKAFQGWFHTLLWKRGLKSFCNTCFVFFAFQYLNCAALAHQVIVWSGQYITVSGICWCRSEGSEWGVIIWFHEKPLFGLLW